MGDLVSFPRLRPEAPPEPLWRTALGQEVRERRRGRNERLVDVAGRAGISAQYLSEIERGLKEPSSEMVAAVAGALELRVLDLTVGAVRRLAAGRLRSGEPVALAA
ncbi:MAG: helix-turn-helix transcriptional regulator [Micropruina glycogenica]|jgi:transcriptional regulator with XRE-family HTH domain|uniref:DNA-binding protein n=1 Tax=Micropruina glycogenica TaxID=75385 RepID=A0A2N9JBY4_9ACTN|nr:helix-turn-helix transcriptional regulator [Micropruina glycogenica]MCB0891437.1 helix-turn-helix transcriptional regulator [Propionibacteriaceae bacterium]SPD85050.1 DNA-binding protein [Micropruina glycogenica]